MWRARRTKLSAAANDVAFLGKYGYNRIILYQTSMSVIDSDNIVPSVVPNERNTCPLSAIRVFCEVVRQNSLSQAAQHMEVTPSAVSQRIKQLESYVGCNLFLRYRHKITLTEEGRFLYEKFNRALGNIEYAVNCIVSGQVNQRIVLGVLASFTAKWLIPRLHRFYRQHPHLQLITRSVNHTIDVERENAELAVVNLPSPPTSSALRSQLLWRENLLTVCSPEYLKNSAQPLQTVADLAQHTLLHDQTEIANRRHLDWKSWMKIAAPAHSINLEGGRFFTQSDLTLQAAIEGHGVAIARLSLAAEDLQKGALIDPLNIQVPAKSGCYMCARKNVWDMPKIVMLREWFVNEAAKDSFMLKGEKI